MERGSKCSQGAIKLRVVFVPVKALCLHHRILLPLSILHRHLLLWCDVLLLYFGVVAVRELDTLAVQLSVGLQRADRSFRNIG